MVCDKLISCVVGDWLGAVAASVAMVRRDGYLCVLQGVVLEQQPTLRQHPVDAWQPDSRWVSVARKPPRVYLGVFFCWRAVGRTELGGVWCVRCVRRLRAVMLAHCNVVAFARASCLLQSVLAGWLCRLGATRTRRCASAIAWGTMA